MKTATLASSAAWLLSQAVAQQFVMYTPVVDDTTVQRIDPILAPGTISQHVHQVFGSNALKPKVTYDSLQTAGCTTVGDASGNGNAADKSIYWHPALFMEAKNDTGYVRVPTAGHKLYYKNAGTGTPRSPFEFPKGFRMLAGNPFMRAPAENVQRQNITQWICHDSSGDNQGTSGGFPNGVDNCDAYPGFNGAVHFPHCWNGHDFNPADPTAHISYPVGDIEEGTCPDSHKIRLPHIFVENQFNLDSVYDVVKPNTFVLAMGDNTGYGWHSDFFNGWDEGAIPALLNSCPQGEYGNEDIGICPTFQASKVSNTDCTLKTFFHENVNDPGPALPGCNPVRDTNPAPYYETAPLGTYSTDCTLIGGGSAPEPPSSSSTTSVAAPSTTLATSTKASKHHKTKTSTPTTTATSLPSGSAISCPESNHKTYMFGGKTFKVQCGIDHEGGDLTMVSAQSLEDCAQQCAETKGCVDVSLSGTACYMKSVVGQMLKDSGINGAKLMDAAEPQAKREAVDPALYQREARHVHHHMRRHAS